MLKASTILRIAVWTFLVSSVIYEMNALMDIFGDEQTPLQRDLAWTSRHTFLLISACCHFDGFGIGSY
jgi:hypothetical protein